MVKTLVAGRTVRKYVFRSPHMRPNKVQTEPMATVALCLRRLSLQDLEKVAIDTGLSVSCLYRWASGDTMHGRADKVFAVMKALAIPMPN